MSHSWVTSDLIKGKTRQFSELKNVENWALWLERSSESQGKRKIFGYDLSQESYSLNPLVLSPEKADIGAKVNEYGGGSWVGYWHKEEKCLVFIYADSKRDGIWKSSFFLENPHKNKEIQIAPAVPEGVISAYADFTLDPENKGVFAIKQSHFPSGAEKQEIVYLPFGADFLSPPLKEEIMVSGKGYFAAPRPSPCGKYLAFFEWQEGEMPWTSTALKILFLGTKEKKTYILSKDNGTESVIEPHWDPNFDENKTVLYALSDKSGAWTPVVFEFIKKAPHFKAVRVDFPQAPEEIGTPPWQFQLDSFLPIGRNQFLGVSTSKGIGKLWHFSARDGWQKILGISPLEIPKRLKNGHFVFFDAPVDAPLTLKSFALSKSFKIEDFCTLRTSWEIPTNLSKKEISLPQFLQIPVSEGISPLYGFYYPPTSKELLRENKPPLLVMVHGGPTAAVTTSLDLNIQYWTSRGFAVLAVDYRGSSGYGRAYRDALNGQWGRLDVMDCCDAARFVIEKGLADPKRAVIRGGSSGGLTALSALAAKNSPFTAACSRYGVTDLTSLMGAGTHRFEAYYLDGLIGKYPEKKAIYEERSPVSWPERFTRPVLFLHGGKDSVVPLIQAESLAQKLPKSSFHLYPEASHGFKDPETIMDALERERDFYQTVFKQQAQENGYEGAQ